MKYAFADRTKYLGDSETTINSGYGSKIVVAGAGFLLNNFKMNIAKAIEMPRIHDQWLPDEIYSEPSGIPEKVKRNLVNMGYKFASPRYIGLAEGIMINQKKGNIFGASDPRGHGLAKGY